MILKGPDVQHRRGLLCGALRTNITRRIERSARRARNCLTLRGTTWRKRES